MATTAPTSIKDHADPLISLRNVDHTYGSGELARRTLQGVSLDILPGEVVILTGPSGSGKTTLLTLCGALRSVQAGSVRTLGCELNGATRSVLQRIREQVGIIFQGHNLLGGLTATQNVALSLGLESGLRPSERTSRARSMLEAVSLDKHFDHYPDQLSGGQKQRAAIARALVREPQVVLADEPTASLDRKSGREVIDLIRSLAVRSNSAVLLVTHDNRILDIADRIVTLDDGRLISFASSIATSTGNVLHAFAHLQQSGDLLKHIRSLSSNQFLEILDNMTAEFRQYVRVFQIGSRDAVQTLFDAVLEATTVKMVEIMHADRGTIYLVDKPGGVLRSRIATGANGERISIEVDIGSSIAGRVVATEEPLNIPDAYESEFFNPEFDKASGYVTKSILCMPVYTREGEIFAVAQLINRSGTESFTRDDEEQFAVFAEPIGVILENCLELQRQIVETNSL